MDPSSSTPSIPSSGRKSPSGILLLSVVVLGALAGVIFAHLSPSTLKHPHLALQLARFIRFALLAFAFLLALMGRYWIQAFGTIQRLQISSLAAEERIRRRYSSEIAQLTSLAFDQVFVFGEAFSVFRLLLIAPAISLVLMLLKREVLSLQNGKIVCTFPIFAARDKSAFAHPFALGVKFHTAFEDGTLLISKTFVGDTQDRPGILVEQRNAGIAEMWAAHKQRMQALEASGKSVSGDISFQAYSEISRRESVPVRTASS
jgi:hypothetical protein